MRRVQTYLLIVLISANGAVVVGCGSPQDERRPVAGRARPASPPTPTRPAVGAWGRSFDAEQNFPDYDLTLVGVSWVQLDHREDENISLVVGYEPADPGTDLQAALDEHLQGFEGSKGSDPLQTGTIESEILGPVLWARSTFDMEGVEMTQLALFARHPKPTRCCSPAPSSHLKAMMRRPGFKNSSAPPRSSARDCKSRSSGIR